MLHANLMDVCFIDRDFIADRSFTLREYIFDLFGSCDLDLDLLTFICEPDPYSLEIYRMCENELLASRRSKVIL